MKTAVKYTGKDRVRSRQCPVITWTTNLLFDHDANHMSNLYERTEDSRIATFET